MGNMNESRLGQVLGSGDAQALFLKVFSAEVLTAFEEKNVMMPLHTVRTISSGKSAQFPMTGTASAEYHVPGDEILGNAINHAERVISIDNLLVSSAFIANIDEAMNHYDVRSIYSRELGYALANHCDKAVIRSGIAGSLDTTDVMGNTAGGNIEVGTTPTAATVVAGIVEAAQTFDKRDVPDTDRYVVIRPEEFYLLVAAAGSTGLSSAVFNNDFNGTGNINQGRQTLQIAGMTVMMSNHIPTADESDTPNAVLGDTTNGVRNDPFGAEGGNASGAAGYSGLDFQNYVGLAFHRSGIGTVKLLDLAMESEYLVQNQGTLMVAKYAMGHNFLRAEACLGIRAA